MGKSVSIPEIVVPVNHSLTFFGDVHLTAGVSINRTFRSMSMHQPSTRHTMSSNNRNKKRMRKRKASISVSEKCVLYDHYFQNCAATNSDIVMNGYHSHQTLPDIEHFAILLYYNIKHCTVPQLQHLWCQLISLCNWSKREIGSLPTIYIRFAHEKNMICDGKLNEKSMDLRELQRIVKAYYDDICPKTICHPEILTKASDNEMDIGAKTTMGGGGGNWYDLVLNELTPMTPFGGEQEDLTIFGSFRPKIAIVATAFAVAVSFGFRISRATNLGYSH